MFHQNINLPLIIESVNFKDLSLQNIFNSHNLSFNKIMILTGGVNSSKFADQIAAKNQSLIEYIHKDTENSLELISTLKSSVYENKIDAIIGIGGGKVLDTAKYLGTKTKLPYFAIPTVVSSDALASPISILKNGEKTKGYSSQIPSGILIDYDIIASSGKKHIHSGLGDIISNLSALNDWDLAVKAGKAKANNFARFLAEVASSNIIYKDVDPEKKNFIHTYVNSIIISGLAMNITKDSRPCSGSEHLIAHSIAKYELNNCSHGFNVGSITPFILFLQNSLEKQFINYCLKIGFTLEFEKLIEKNFNLSMLITNARTIKKNRFTILDTFTDEEISEKYSEYKQFLNGNNFE